MQKFIYPNLAHYEWIVQEHKSLFQSTTIISTYLTNILFAYSTQDAGFDAIRYFNLVYRANVDVFGFLLIFQSFMTKTVARSTELDLLSCVPALQKIISLAFKFDTRPIPHNLIHDYLEELYEIQPSLDQRSQSRMSTLTSL